MQVIANEAPSHVATFVGPAQIYDIVVGELAVSETQLLPQHWARMRDEVSQVVGLSRATSQRYLRGQLQRSLFCCLEHTKWCTQMSICVVLRAHPRDFIFFFCMCICVLFDFCLFGFCLFSTRFCWFSHFSYYFFQETTLFHKKHRLASAGEHNLCFH